MRQPLIAALHGYVLGSGLEMALCCDIRIASEDSRFGLPEGGLGLIPAAGGTQTLGRVTGQAKAVEIAGGIGILLGKEWGRILGILNAALSSLAFPIGTAIGVLVLIYLLSTDVKKYFEGNP